MAMSGGRVDHLLKYPRVLADDLRIDVGDIGAIYCNRYTGAWEACIFWDNERGQGRSRFSGTLRCPNEALDWVYKEAANG